MLAFFAPGVVLPSERWEQQSSWYRLMCNAAEPPVSKEGLTMSSTTDKIKGVANEAIGNIKQGIGNATDNDKLKAEGKAQELKGETQKTVGDAKDGIKNAADTVKSKI
jgi:uncharacterized protein YjbJ (UPF0337 family)